MRGGGSESGRVDPAPGRRWSPGFLALPVWALAALFALVACGSQVEPGEAHLRTEGAAPWSIVPPDAPLGGVVELGRVWFAGNDLNTDLVGDPDPIQADGWTLTVGTGRFSFPRSERFESYSALLPFGPELEAGESMRCEVQRGGASSAVGSVSVDLGHPLTLSGADQRVLFEIARRPIVRDRGTRDPVAYFTREQTRAPDDLIGPGNWTSGGGISLTAPGANPTGDRLVAVLPFAVTIPDVLALPLKLSGLTFNGEAVLAPVRSPEQGDVLAAGPSYTLPGPGGYLDIGWDAWSQAQTVVLSLEYYGGGEGRCPAACTQGGGCCERDDQCRVDTEVCGTRWSDGTRVCMPRYGDGRDRLGALVCTIQDSGQARLDAEQVSELESTLSSWGLLDAVRGVVLRVGRRVAVSVSLPDVMMADGTAQSISPVRVQAVDMAIVRMERFEE